MRLCLAGTFPAEKVVRENRPEYVLESFFYIKPWQVEEMPKWKMFLLDSGAFTFMHGIEASSKPVDWNGYLSRYIDFINRHDVQHFFELDVDIIVGYDVVKRMRARLEAETGKQSIPVWHRSRGLDEFKRLCRDYPYIGIGGFAIDRAERARCICDCNPQQNRRGVPLILERESAQHIGHPELDNSP